MLFAFVCVAGCVVIHGSDSSFMTMLSSSDKPVVVAFSDDTNPVGIRLLKRWVQIEEDFADDKRVILSQVSSVRQKKMCLQLGVRFVPLVACFRGNETRVDYSGPREYENLKAWVEHMASPPVVNVSSVSEDDLIGNRNYVTFVLSNPDMFEEFERIADHYKNTSNRFIFSQGALEHDVVAIMRDDFRDHFDASRDGSLQNFIWRHQFPLGFELTKFNYLEAVRSGRVLAILIVNPAMSGNNKRVNAFVSLAREFHDQFAFARMDGITYGDFIKTLDVNRYPCIAFIDDPNEQHLVIDFDTSKLRDQLHGIVNGSIPFHRFSVWRKIAYLSKHWVVQRWQVVTIVLVLFAIIVLAFCQLIMDMKENAKIGLSLRDILFPWRSPKGYVKLD